MAGLTWSPTGQEPQEMTRSGAPIYSGSAIGFDPWELIVMTRWTSYAATREEDKPMSDRNRTEYVSKVLEGLNDDAMQVAQDMDRAELISKDGIPKLVKGIKK